MHHSITDFVGYSNKRDLKFNSPGSYGLQFALNPAAINNIGDIIYDLLNRMKYSAEHFCFITRDTVRHQKVSNLGRLIIML